MSVEFFVRLRDAAEAEIERLKPSELEEKIDYNPENIPWIQAEGPNGVYQRFPAYQQKPGMTKDYLNLLEDLKRHNGKLQRNGLFYWLFNDEQTIGRKPAKK